MNTNQTRRSSSQTKFEKGVCSNIKKKVIQLQRRVDLLRIFPYNLAGLQDYSPVDLLNSFDILLTYCSNLVCCSPLTDNSFPLSINIGNMLLSLLTWFLASCKLGCLELFLWVAC